MHTQVRCICSARKLLESLVGSKFSMYLWPIVDVASCADRELACQGDGQKVAGKSLFSSVKAARCQAFYR